MVKVAHSRPVLCHFEIGIAFLSFHASFQSIIRHSCIRFIPIPDTHQYIMDGHSTLSLSLQYHTSYIPWSFLTLRHYVGTGANTVTAKVSRKCNKSNQHPLRDFAYNADTPINAMTGFNALPMADEAATDGSTQWAGVAKVLGPPWARFPAITVGLAGVQVMWSIEMAYGEQVQQGNLIPVQDNDPCSLSIPPFPWPQEIPNGPCLRRWTASWSYRSASHWFAQALSLPRPPNQLITCAGVMADNSRSRFGRRRPFIVAGVAICSMALILLGFTRNFASIITEWGSPAVSITPFRPPIQAAYKHFRTTF